MKKLLLILLTFISLTGSAQLQVKEGSFKHIPNAIMNDKHEHLDGNDLPMALIKVSTENIPEQERLRLKFQGNLATQITKTPKTGQMWIYISAENATFINIMHPDYGTCKYYLPEKLCNFCTYEMVLQYVPLIPVSSSLTEQFNNNTTIANQYQISTNLDNNYDIRKHFTTINYAYSVSPQHSFGFTIGYVNKYGFYFSAMAGGEFNALTTDLHCDEYGNIDGELQLYSGNTTSSRLSGIVGAMYRPIDFMAVKFGLGYGVRFYAWETQNGNWTRNDKYSVNGMEINAGLHFFLKRVSLSVDLISTNMKYFEVKFGLGINNL